MFGDHVSEDVEAYEIDGAEGGGARPAYGLAGERVDSSMVRSISCIRRITLSTENVPMRLAMKLGVSFAAHDAFA
jgi:hypothetical protein